MPSSTTPKPKKSDRYIEAVGRRKTAIARVRISPASKTNVLINDRSIESYFPVATLAQSVLSPLALAPSAHFSVSVHVVGGGIRGQAEAVRHGIARALTLSSADLRTPLKRAGFLTRDPRAKERRKFGLKKARKAPQWSK
ncbi:MAG: 30S ribosomal protein S9, partial [Patescibacteria group bacterium]|nr:30S ribosomal protein S9 [Patescibacteria group bacterium]